MKKIFTCCLLFFIASHVFAQEKYYKLHIPLNTSVTIERLASLGLEVDHGTYKKTFFESDFSETEKALLQTNAIPFDVLINDVSKFYKERNATTNHDKKTRAVSCHAPNPTYTTPAGFGYGSMGGYLTYQEAIAKLDSLPILFPNLVTSKQPIDTFLTEEGRPIYFMKISDNANTNEAEPQVLFDAVHHAREVITVSQIVYFMYYLCENYATNPEVKRLVDNIEFYFVPIVNPDGYVYNYTTDPSGGGMWRKNRRDNGAAVYGVDLNRNYPLGWGFNNIGSSPTNTSNTYRGLSAGSEPETKAMLHFCNTHQFRFGINYHSYSNLIVYPWGYLGKNCDDSVAYRAFAADLTKYNFYKSGTDLETVGYSTNGSSDDWMYGETVTKPMLFAMTPEVGNGDDGFWPIQNRIIPLCEEANYMNLTIAKYMLQYAAVQNVSSRLANGSNGFMKYNINRLGLDTSATFTVTLTAISPQITAVGSTNSYSNLVLAQTYIDSISYTLQSGIANNTPLQFALTCTSGSFSETDTITLYYGNEVTVYSSDASSFTGWQNNGWATDATKYLSASTSFAENSSGKYANNYDAELVTPSLDLSQAARAELLYRATWELENSFDYVLLEASTNGTSFSPLCGSNTQPSADVTIPGEVYTGAVTDWKYEIIKLDDYVSNANVVLRWTFHSDAGLNMQGFNMDNFVVNKLSTVPAIVSYNSINAISIYPNPSNEVLHLSSKEKMIYAILSIDGREVVQGECSDIISVKNIPAGLYQLVLKNENGYSQHSSISVIH
jgi:carboxypeptidase T